MWSQREENIARDIATRNSELQLQDRSRALGKSSWLLAPLTSDKQCRTKYSSSSLEIFGIGLLEELARYTSTFIYQHYHHISVLDSCRVKQISALIYWICCCPLLLHWLLLLNHFQYLAIKTSFSPKTLSTLRWSLRGTYPWFDPISCWFQLTVGVQRSLLKQRQKHPSLQVLNLFQKLICFHHLTA